MFCSFRKKSMLDNEGKKIVYVLSTGEEFERRDVVVGDEYGESSRLFPALRPASASSRRERIS